MAYNSKSLTVSHSASIKWDNKQLLRKNEMGFHVLTIKNLHGILSKKSTVCVSLNTTKYSFLKILEKCMRNLKVVVSETLD